MLPVSVMMFHINELFIDSMQSFTPARLISLMTCFVQNSAFRAEYLWLSLALSDQTRVISTFLDVRYFPNGIKFQLIRGA